MAARDFTIVSGVLVENRRCKTCKHEPRNIGACSTSDRCRSCLSNWIGSQRALPLWVPEFDVEAGVA